MLRDVVHEWVLKYPETDALLLDRTSGKMKSIPLVYTKDVDEIFDNYHVVTVDITENTHTIIINCWIDE